MTVPPPDGSRDRRIEDPTNLWLIHPAARALLPLALRWRVPANAVSIAGLVVGIGAAICYSHWQLPGERVSAVLAALALSVGWLILDGLDGMVARATGTASAVGRLLDGVVDHGIFILIYVTLAGMIGTVEGWVLAIAAGALHIVQSAIYEGERARFHRRQRGVALVARTGHRPVETFLERGYDWLATLPERGMLPFERTLAASADPQALGRTYAARAVPAMRVEALLSANVRVGLIALACLLGNPRLFWWAEIVPLSLVALYGLHLHRRAERSFVHLTASGPGVTVAAALSTRDL